MFLKLYGRLVIPNSRELEGDKCTVDCRFTMTCVGGKMRVRKGTVRALDRKE